MTKLPLMGGREDRTQTMEQIVREFTGVVFHQRRECVQRLGAICLPITKEQS